MYERRCPDRAAAKLIQVLDSYGAIRYRNQAERAAQTRPPRSAPYGSRQARRRGRRDAQRARGRDRAARGARQTNPEIAGELCLSVKTVETHVRNIFRKLDAASRVEVARVLERAERGSDELRGSAAR
ncbi:MAG: response regulator transcription factor [Thermoleophilaceae bacterium]|nr:response regulator transcription factor [Thermoleophilaceae bacterium]